MFNALSQSKYMELKYKKIISLFAIIILIIPSYIFPSVISAHTYMTAFAQSANITTKHTTASTTASTTTASTTSKSPTTPPTTATTSPTSTAIPTDTNTTTSTPVVANPASLVTTTNSTPPATPSNVLFPSSSNPATSTTYGVNNYATYSPNNFPTFPNNGVDTDKAPAFLDAYWTNYLSSSSSVSSSAVKKEVGPGDGASTLAVVLVNAGRNDITGVTGYLNLPPSTGFVPMPGESNGTQAVASAYSVVKAGSTFVLYFDMNVLKQAKVGGYSFPLTIQYTKVNQLGQLLTTFNVPFRLTGKVILDAIVENAQLTPSTPNHLKILLENKGTASATGVVATVLQMTNNGYSGNSNNGILFFHF